MDERLEQVEDGYVARDQGLVLSHQQMKSYLVSFKILVSQNWGNYKRAVS